MEDNDKLETFLRKADKDLDKDDYDALLHFVASIPDCTHRDAFAFIKGMEAMATNISMAQNHLFR